jgi:hypothetical protein
VGSADFDRDGEPDILFQNQNSGQLYVWLMSGATQVGSGFLSPSGVSPEWRVVQLADFNSDGRTDLLFQNRDSGLLYAWFMNGTSRTGAGFLSPRGVSPDWQIR